jgi:hypothetical protein
MAQKNTNTEEKTEKQNKTQNRRAIEEVIGADLSMVIRRLTASSSHHRRRLVYIVREGFGFEREGRKSEI